MRDYKKLIDSCGIKYADWVTSLIEDYEAEDGLMLYSRDSIPERNETYLMSERLPAYLMIAQEGDMLFVLEFETEGPVYRTDFRAMSEDKLEQIATSFSAWLKSDFSLPIEPDYHLPLRADIFIDNVPDLKTLFSINRVLTLNLGASQMKSLLSEQPFLAIENGPPIALERCLEDSTELNSFIFYKKDDDLIRIGGNRIQEREI